MYRAMKSKLQSNHGASMILVLALLFVCVMVSSVIIFGASSGMSRSAQRVRQQKAYLAVTSAADLITNELKLANEYVGVNTTRKYGCENCNIPVEMIYFGSVVSGYRLDGDYIGNPLDDGHLMIAKSHTDMGEDKQTDAENTKAFGSLGAMLMRAAEHVYQMESGYSEQLKIELADGDDRMPAVDCVFAMDEEYHISFALTTADSDYGLTIEASALVQPSERTPEEEEEDMHTVYYKRYDTMTGAYVDEKNEAFKIPVEVTEAITRVTWNIPEVEKGVLN